MPDLTLAEMAREIERRRKNTLPRRSGGWMEDRLIDVIDGNIHVIGFGDMQEDDRGILEDGLAHCVLRDSMLLAMVQHIPARLEAPANAVKPGGFWSLSRVSPGLFYDCDHGNCPTRSLFAAFLAAFPEPTP